MDKYNRGTGLAEFAVKVDEIVFHPLTAPIAVFLISLVVAVVTFGAPNTNNELSWKIMSWTMMGITLPMILGWIANDQEW